MKCNTQITRNSVVVTQVISNKDPSLVNINTNGRKADHLFLCSGFLVAPRTALVAQTVKRLPTMRKNGIPSLGWEDALEKEMATHSNTLAWKIPWMEKRGRLQSVGLQRVGHDRVTSLSFFLVAESWSYSSHRSVFLWSRGSRYEGISSCSRPAP